MSLADAARKTIKPARPIKSLRKKDYRTPDIIDLVQEVIRTDVADTEEFASFFQPTRKSLKELFDFVDQTFTYSEDPKFNQWVQAPSFLFASKRGDCKSYTVFISSVLQNMGVDHLIRYTARYTSNFRHVYPVALLKGKEIPMDVVWKQQEGGRFGTEKHFTKK